MGHTKSDLLKDIQKELELIEQLEGVKQKSPGVFYLKAIPFLHFHDKDGKRWADIKDPSGDWVSIEIDFVPSVKDKKDFIKAAQAAHTKLYIGKGKSKS